MCNDFPVKFEMLHQNKKDLEEILSPSLFSRNINEYQRPIQKIQQFFLYL